MGIFLHLGAQLQPSQVLRLGPHWTMPLPITRSSAIKPQGPWTYISLGAHLDRSTWTGLPVPPAVTCSGSRQLGLSPVPQFLKGSSGSIEKLCPWRTLKAELSLLSDSSRLASRKLPHTKQSEYVSYKQICSSQGVHIMNLSAFTGH